MSRYDVIKGEAYALVTDKAYVKRWFDACGFFKETFATTILRDRFFITEDYMMTNNPIFAVREITPDGIETIAGPLDTLNEAYDALADRVGSDRITFQKENGA